MRILVIAHWSPVMATQMSSVPSVISAVINELKNLRIGSQYGTPNVTGAGTVAASDGRAIKSQTVNIECPGLTSAKGVTVLVYTLNANGTKSVRVVKPRFSKGKLKVEFPGTWGTFLLSCQ